MDRKRHTYACYIIYYEAHTHTHAYTQWVDRLCSLISVWVWVSLVPSLLQLLLLLLRSPKNIHIMNIKRRFCVMINFHVIKLAKGRRKNICEWIAYIWWTCTTLPYIHVSFCFVFFAARFSSFRTHLPIAYFGCVCVCSTSLLIIWLVGFDQSQCQSNVCVCVFSTNFFNLSVYFYMRNECAKKHIKCVRLAWQIRLHLLQRAHPFFQYIAFFELSIRFSLMNFDGKFAKE